MAARESISPPPLVGGIFASAEHAARAIKDLVQAHFEKEDIAVAIRKGAGGNWPGAPSIEHDETDAAFRARMHQTFGAVLLTRTAPAAPGPTSDLGQYFTRAVEQGKALVTVEAGERRAEIVQILRRHGADLGPVGAEPAVAGVTTAPPPQPAAAAPAPKTIITPPPSAKDPPSGGAVKEAEPKSPVATKPPGEEVTTSEVRQRERKFADSPRWPKSG